MKLFSDASYLLTLEDDHEIGAVILYPFWGDPWADRDHVYGPRYDEWIKHGKNVFEMTSLDDADIAVFPSQWITKTHPEHPRFLALFDRFYEMATAHQKKIALFFQNDSDEKIPNRDGMTVFRTTIYASKQRPNEFAAPYWSTDILAEYAHNQVVIRKKKRQATVGFCGYPGFSSSEQLPLRRRLKEGLKSLYMRMPHSVTNSGILRHYHANSVVRAKAIQILQRSKQIGRNFILRDNVWGGFGHYRLPDGSFNYDLTRKTFRDYVANMFQSDYILCCRGKGNYSIRLYEALCCGRIPVFINTDCALPFQDQLDWKKHCVWVESYELPLIEEKILRFHDALTDRDFCELQKQCRELYLNFISPLGYFTNFYRFFS